MLFHELASKLHASESAVEPHAKSIQQGLFQKLAQSDIPPEQLAALLSGDHERMEALRNHAHATGQAELPPLVPESSIESPSVSPEGLSVGPQPPEGDTGGFESDETPPSPSEPSSEPLAGKPGGSVGSDEGGFSLQQQKVREGAAPVKTPDTGGEQKAFFHGLNDAPGQEKLFGGMDLAGNGDGQDADAPTPGERSLSGQLSDALAEPPEPRTTPSTAIARPDEIPYETAYRAHSGTSFVPETRAKQRQKDYADTLNGDYDSLSKLAKNDEERKTLADEFARYKDGYRRHYLEYLHANSRIVSTMIAGPANFPVRQMEKRNNTAHKRLNELLEFRKRALAAIQRKLRPEDGPIKSSDKNAVEHLQTKLKAHEDLHARMKAVNAAHKKFLKEPSSLDAADLSDDDKAHVRNYKPAYGWEPHPYPPYRLTNNNATIKQIKDRIASVSKMQSSAPKEESHGGVKLVENPDAGRIQLVFPGKPDDATRSKLKSAGFRWSPREGAWQRHLNESGRSAAKRVLESLKSAE
jgi:hypothetical protein